MDNSIQPIKNNVGGQTIIKPITDATTSNYSALLRQVEAEYQASKAIQDPKVEEWQRRLRLYNNQKRAKDATGDRLLYQTMQTLLASFYEDQLITQWVGRTDDAEDVADNLNSLAIYDSEIMHKDVFDYFWLWDTLFFGRSIVYMTDFDRATHTPIPDLQNPMLFYRDGKAVAINGYPWNQRNASRFFGRWIEMTKPQMQNHPEFFDVDTIQPSAQANSDIMQARNAYQDAQGLGASRPGDDGNFGDNKMYDLLEWCTHWQGQKILVTVANNRKKVVRFHVFKDAKGMPAKLWSVIDRPLSPMSHTWDSVSIPDITEDDQRLRAILKNLAVKHQKADLYPMNLYDKKRIKNKADLDFGFNKNIPVIGEGDVRAAIAPMIKSPFNAAVHQYIMDMLSSDVERSAATPDIQQGALSSQQRTATEVNKTDRNVGTRYSLTSKILGWSEKDFWLNWYQRYKENLTVMDEKIVRISAVLGAKFRPMTKENIIAKIDPDVDIISRYVRDAQQLQKRQDFAQYLGMVAQIPGSNMRYGVIRMGRLINLQKDELEILIPLTIDERVADQENILLSKNQKVLVNASDNHLQHLVRHAMATPTAALLAHIATHEHALYLQKTRPDLFPGIQQQQSDQAASDQQTAGGLAQITSPTGQAPTSTSSVPNAQLSQAQPQVGNQ